MPTSPYSNRSTVLPLSTSLTLNKKPPPILSRGWGKELELLGFYNILMLLIPSQVYMDQEFLIQLVVR